MASRRQSSTTDGRTGVGHSTRSQQPIIPDLRKTYLPYGRSHTKHEKAVRDAEAALHAAESEDPGIGVTRDAYPVPADALAGGLSGSKARASAGGPIASDFESDMEHGRSGRSVLKDHTYDMERLDPGWSRKHQ